MQKKFGKGALAALGLSAVLALTACGSAAGEQSDEPYTGTLDMSLPLGEGSHQHVGVKAFGDKLEELTEGRIKVKYHYNNALGGEREVVEGMSINSIDMGISSTGPIGGFAPDFFLFDLPYLMDNPEHAYAVLDSEIGEDLATSLEETANVKVLAWMENGFRHETNSVRAINTPEDLKGIKHRTQESEVQVDTWTALGANATPMAWPEVYTALQQNVMESQENPLPTIYDVKFYEVQDYLNMTQHVYSPAPMMMSKKLFDSFSEEDQQAIMEAAEYALPIQRQASQDQEAEMKKKLVEEGMELTEPDLEPFRKAVEPVYEKWAPEIGQELVDEVKNFKY
jgi:tripartite ATP-independent transporter DctP family solute receptor